MSEATSSTAWNGSAWRVPILNPADAHRPMGASTSGGEWFSVPAVFPATQFYYVSTVLPAVADRPVLAAVVAAPIPLVVPVVVMFLAICQVAATDWRSRVVRRAESPMA